MELWDQYKVITQQLEHQVLEFFAVGWNPSSNFDSDGRAVFNVDMDLKRIPTRTYPFTNLYECLIPIIVYLCIILFGELIFLCKSKKDKKPLISASFLYGLKFLYNLCQIFLCAYMSLESLILANRNSFYLLPLTKSRCNKFNFSEPIFSELLWLFYVSKIFDFFDTIFIILGNKRAQFTFLHKYHHITIYLIYWLNVNLSYDSDIYLTVTLNAFIHSIMYTYYFLSMHMPKEIDKKTKRPKYTIWWKKYLTMLQMTQFSIMNIQAILIIVNGCNELPPRVIIMYLGYIITLFAMFLNFFFKSFGKKGKTMDKKKRK